MPGLPSPVGSGNTAKLGHRQLRRCLSRHQCSTPRFAAGLADTRLPGGAQDAQEFLNYLLNECSELLEKEVKAAGAPQPAWRAAAYANGAPAALNGYAAPAGAASPVARGAAEGATQAVDYLVLHLLFLKANS